MIKVIVCEDQDEQLSEIVDIIEKKIMIEDFDMKLTLATKDPNEVISYINGHESENALFFLDVDLKSDISGINLGSAIREKIPGAKIVFVTTHSELAYMTFVYKIEAMDYIPKDDRLHFAERIRECVSAANERYIQDGETRHQKIPINVDDRTIQIPVDEVLFVESSSSPHKLAIHLNNRIIEYYGKIKEVENFSPHFVRSHQSYVLNINNISEIDKPKRIAVMKDGEECLISVRYMKKLIEALKRCS